LNPKLQKVHKEIERTKARIAELQALLPGLEQQKIELENAEVIKAFRSADVAPGDFTAFIEAYRSNAEFRMKNAEQDSFLHPSARLIDTREEHHDDEE
jgi:hypothetical protein